MYYRALEELFRLSARSLAVKYSLSVSVLEIYNENVRDLLCSEQKKYLLSLLLLFMLELFSIYLVY